MFVTLLLCIPFVGAGLFFLWLTVESGKDWLELLTRRNVRCSVLATEGGPGRVKLTGKAAPGPDGLLTAPLSGTPCVWWWVDTGEDHQAAKAPDDEKRPTIKSESEHSNAPFLLSDDTGSITIPIGDLRIRGLPESARRSTPHPDHPRVHLLQKEYLVLPGTPLTASGRHLHPSSLAPDGLTITTPALHPSPWPRLRLTLFTLALAAFCLALPAYIIFDITRPDF